MMRDFTLILPYYENPGMFRVQQDHWLKRDGKYRARLRVIVVDDGSPEHPAIDYVRPGIQDALDFRLYRIGVDVRWNWLAARNLGAAETETEWMLLTDMDHVLSTAAWQAIAWRAPLNPGAAYRLQRRDAPDDIPYKPHPDSYLLTRKLFDRAGGYDERLAGFYGTSGEFRDRLAKHVVAFGMLPAHLIRYPREVVADASTTAYDRKTAYDRDGLRGARARIAREGGPPLRGSFPWERLL